MEEWRIKWIRMAILRLHTLSPNGFTVRQVSNAAFNPRALTKRLMEEAEVAGWLREADRKPSKSGKTIEIVYQATDFGRQQLIASASLLKEKLSSSSGASREAYFHSIIEVEECVARYLDKVEKGEDTFPTMGDTDRINFKKSMKACFADYEALKDLDATAAADVRKRLWQAIQKADEGVKRESPRYKGNLLDYFKGEG